MPRVAPVIVSFSPIVRVGAKTLILGSMPGKRSLQEQQYYAHPQNSFWSIMGKLFGAGKDQKYEERIQILTSCGIAVWDVLQACHRAGSLDSAIDETSAVPNNFKKFFIKYPQIKFIFFNGCKSEQMYKRYVLPELPEKFANIAYKRLPSTSPAHASMTRAEKLKQWRVIKNGTSINLKFKTT